MNKTRRQLLGALTGLGVAHLAGCSTMKTTNAAVDEIFDAHFHIIDPRYPIVANQGYVPPTYPLTQYLSDTKPLRVTAGAVVSGSFHGFDQSYLLAALQQLGPRWVGVTQVPSNISDQEIRQLSTAGVRALRFNFFRGSIDAVDDVVSLANRAYDVGGWHAEIYTDAATLRPQVAKLAKLPRIVIDHLGMSEAGLPVILDLVDAGARIKATGFGRVDMDVAHVIAQIGQRSPDALMFGTDLPSTRAKRPFDPKDIALIRNVLGPELAHKALWSNAVELYKPRV